METKKNQNMAGLMEAAGGIIDTGMGLATANYNDKRQREQASYLQGTQLAGQKEMGKFNQALAIDTWEKTGMAAQRKQMEKAGLNVGLMYKGSGPGGATAAPAGGVSGQSAAGAPMDIKGMGIQSALQLEALKLAKNKNIAEIENINADTDKKRAETPGEGQTQEKLGQEIEALKTSTEGLKITNANKALEGDILNFKKEQERINTTILTESMPSLIEQTKSNAKLLAGKAETAYNEGRMSSEAYDEQLKQIKLDTVEQGIRITGLKLGNLKTSKDILMVDKMMDKITKDMELIDKQKDLTEAQREGRISDTIKNAVEQEFKTGTAAQVIQWSEAIGAFFGTPIRALKGG